MSESTIRAEIVSQLEEVSNIGTVVDRPGYLDGWAQKSPDAPLVVLAMPGGAEEEGYGLGTDTFVRYGYQIRVFLPYNFERNSQAVFDLLIENIRAQFRLLTTLNSTAHHTKLMKKMPRDSEFVQLAGGVLCHFAVLEYNIQEIKA